MDFWLDVRLTDAFQVLPRAGAQTCIDKDAIASWCYDPATRTMVTYDTPEAATLKVEYIKRLDEDNTSLSSLRELMRKGRSMYERSKGKASQASYTRAKEMMKEGRWGLVGANSTPHPVLLRKEAGGSLQKKLEEEQKRKELLQAVSAFRPAETVLEIGTRGNAETAALMKQRRQALNKAARRAQLASTPAAVAEDDGEEGFPKDAPEIEMADEETIAVSND